MLPNQAVSMMTSKKTGATSESGSSRSETINAPPTLATAKPYRRTADDSLCTEVAESDIPETFLNTTVLTFAGRLAKDSL